MRRAKLSRRAFLVGTGGICVALPMLEATHGDAWAAPSGPVAKRLIVFFSHGGTITCRSRKGSKEDGTKSHHGKDLWAPADPGPNLIVGEEMAPLANVASELILLRGVDNMAGTLQQHGGGHRHANVTAMTCADTTANNDDAKPLGPSLDQVLAERLSSQNAVPFPSIDLMVHGHNYGTPFYRSKDEAVSSETDPNKAFARLFEGVSPSGEPDPALVALRERQKSVLDGVLDGFSSFRNKLGAADRARVDAHADHIRGMEQKLATLDNLGACSLPEIGSLPSKPSGELVGPLMVDILVHALRCGLTQVATLQVGDLITSWLGTPFGVDLGHSLGHAARDVGPTGPSASRQDDFFAEIVPNRQWRMGLFAQLVQALKDTPEGAGSMLDESVLLFTSEFSTASVHSVRDVPVLLAGKAGGRWQTGRHIDYNKAAKSDPNALGWDTDASTHNVYTSILHAFGFDDAHFGNDAAYRTGPLSELA